MSKRNVVIDPIHGKIELPQWLVRIKDEAPIRRMMGIKQLGLKAFVDFPGAIHNRYLHSVGTMFLAEKLSSLLVKKEETSPRPRADLVENLKNNRNALMAAGFFHDIGHGPFSHVLDFILENKFKVGHESLATEIVKKFQPELEADSIPVNQINNIITRKAKYPFLWEIINGPLDVDKVDYVLRDSYHVGLRYSFDLDHFFDQILVLGEEEDLEKCELGLANSSQAIACIELFLLLWKNMYTLVYLAESSRIAEKMLEKAIIVALQNGSELIDEIRDLDKYMDLDESKLTNLLNMSEGFPEDICERIFKNLDLYIPVLDKNVHEFDLHNRNFVEKLWKQNNEDNIADIISQNLSENLSSKPYSIICDIIRTRTPKEIYINERDEDGEPIEIKQKSEVVNALSKSEMTIKIYVHPELKKTKKKLAKEKTIKTELQKLINNW
jgi:HD superfamily phosphohydrolase